MWERRASTSKFPSCRKPLNLKFYSKLKGMWARGWTGNLHLTGLAGRKRGHSNTFAWLPHIFLYTASLQIRNTVVAGTRLSTWNSLLKRKGSFILFRITCQRRQANKYFNAGIGNSGIDVGRSPTGYSPGKKPNRNSSMHLPVLRSSRRTPR